MSLLRTIATFSEKTSSGHTKHHLLLLSQLERKKVTAYTNSTHMNKLGTSNLAQGDDDDVGLSPAVGNTMTARTTSHGQTGVFSGGLLCLSCVSIKCQQTCKDQTKLLLKRREDEEKYYSMFTTNSLEFINCSKSSYNNEGLNSIGLVHALVDILLKQPYTSPFYYEIASTVHKWLQGARPVEQDLLVKKPGFLHWIVEQLIVVKRKPLNTTNSTGSEIIEPNSMCAFQHDAEVQQVCP